MQSSIWDGPPSPVFNMRDGWNALIAEYKGFDPQFTRPPAFVGAAAAVLGRAAIGEGAWLGARSVIRADGHFVKIGNDFFLGDGATVHIAHDVYPTHIGNTVTVGNGAVVHACTVENDCVIERRAIILDGAKVGSGAVISADSIVFPRTELEGGWLYSGIPARKVAPISADKRRSYHRQTRNERSASGDEMLGGFADQFDCFVAPSVQIKGVVMAGEGVGIWYGCRLDAGDHSIQIGDGTNVQDNSDLICENGPLVIDEDVTIGHNVTLVDCHVSRGSLVGIGSRIAEGTVVESDVLVAAGSETEPGQRLTAGHVWAGRPARPIGPMDDRKRKILAETPPIYRSYAEQFRKTEHRVL